MSTKVCIVKAVVFPVVMYGYESWTIKKAEHQSIDALNWRSWTFFFLTFEVGEDHWEFLGHQGVQTTQSSRKSTLNIHWKDWCWSWISNSLTTWCEELTHWKRPWCWERLKAGGEKDDRRWDGWMVLLIWWTWVWASSGDGDGQGSLACHSPWVHKELDTTSNWTTRQCISYISWDACLSPKIKQVAHSNRIKEYVQRCKMLGNHKY